VLLEEVIMNGEARVDDYISRLPDWQQAICQQVRQLVHDADPEVEETIKRSVLPYFVLQGNICALLAAKDHVNVFIYDPTVARAGISRLSQAASRELAVKRTVVPTPTWIFALDGGRVGFWTSSASGK
jgi:hypothetical protein